MSFIVIDPSRTVIGKFGTAKLLDDIRNDLNDLDARTTANSPSSGLDDHFVRVEFNADHSTETSRSFPVGVDNATPLQFGFGVNWQFKADDDVVNAVKPDFSVARFQVTKSGGTVATNGEIRSHLGYAEAGITDPITLTIRFKASTDIDVKMGLTKINGTNHFVAGNFEGIYVIRQDATNWKFHTNNGIAHDGTAFATPTAGSWHELKIIFNSGRADCYIDDSLKSSFTVDLPTTDFLNAFVAGVGLPVAGPEQTLDLDRAVFSVGGLLDAP